MSDIISQLKWRYATKSFDPTYKLSQQQLDLLTEAIRLSPSSFGLQPWGFIVVSDPETRKKLRVAGYDQSQITDASHLFVFARKTTLTQADVDEFVALTAKERDQAVADLTGLSETLTNAVLSKPQSELESWMGQQTHIALGVMITACAIEGIDACPMGGFDSTQFDEILGLKAKGLTSLALCAVGKRAADDTYADKAKVRFPKEKVITVV
ncbi:MAG: NAD(P)H-dependent oxidoreductase [Candidatus Pacebacteria bacterium]|nr:NAD(P)H-dependent oxidoreductase [Candidatus Paceibacterota bacterium]PIR60128.1 MAG: NAD(P)H-dependent oxidoreductase [Candidatus Pacebacteria bacterium CG10_big_fil_rev_8_21_14_0_10_44_54]